MGDVLKWLAACAGSAVVAAGVTWWLVSRKLNSRLSDYRSLSEAVAAVKARQQTANTEAALAGSRLAEVRQELTTVEARTKHLLALEERAAELEQLVAGEAEHRERAEATRQELHELKSELDLYSRIDDLVDYGHYEEPEYLYETSERFASGIKRIREAQKEMIRDGTAIHLPDGVEVDGSAKSGSAILKGQSKLMLRAYNVEADLLIGKVRPSNFERTLERLEKNAEQVEKLALSLECGIAPEYVELKYRECALQYQYRLRKEEEQAEQKLIREQMREEAKARREYEAALAAAEKEEKLYEDLLARAREEMDQAEGTVRAELTAKVAALETQLAEAEAKSQRAKSMAEQTRRGHVYVVSNVGSFGDDVFKIGLTRRLEPLDRIKELGDASVPFPFDVHAVIFAEDAPGLETALHRKFDDQRVNAVNRRKEFFRVSLDDVEAAVGELADGEVDFRKTILAEEYFETLRLQG